MIARLVAIAGQDQGRQFILNTQGGPVLFGRSQQHAEHALNDPHVSRLHFQIEEQNGQFVLTDMGSSGGTCVNGRKVSQHQLKMGDVIRVGETQLRLQSEAAAPEQARGPDAPRSPNKLEDLPGQKLGHYQVGAMLAKGASGCVFKAHDTKEGRTVALKVLWPEFSTNDEEMQRFVRTMKTLLPLCHPNLVMIYGAGRSGPFCWVAMEFVEGESLTSVIKRVGSDGKLDWKYALRVAIHLCRALNYAQQQQIIHRNITPANILIRSSDQQALLGDLMLAKALEGTLANQITKPGELLGDVSYLSPERTKGTAEVDGRSDIFSLGATTYALLTGRPPFEGLSLLETVMKIRQSEPKKPKQYQPAIPDAVENAVLKMLAKRPEDRYQTAAELLAALERLAKMHGVGV
jgi:serine/threonine protein kinase